MTLPPASKNPTYSPVRLGFFLSLFVCLIAGGIAIKRMAGHSEFVVLFHLPAAVFLVLSGLEVRKKTVSHYEKEIEQIRARYENPTPPESGGKDISLANPVVR